MRIDRQKSTRSHIPRGSGILRRQSGQTLLEVALLTPLLLLMLLGVIEMGRYAYKGILVGNAARAGAAYGAQSLPQSACSPSSACAICDAASLDFQGSNVPCTGGTQSTGPNGTITITTSNSCGCDSSGTIAPAACVGTGAGTCVSGHWVVMVSVTASGTFSALFSYPGIPPSIAISRTCTMRVAN